MQLWVCRDQIFDQCSYVPSYRLFVPECIPVIHEVFAEWCCQCTENGDPLEADHDLNSEEGYCPGWFVKLTGLKKEILPGNKLLMEWNPIALAGDKS